MTQSFTIRQIYLKDLSFQAPMGVAVFTQEWAPKVKVDMKTTQNAVGGNLIEVTLTISVLTTTAGDTAYMIEAIQAGIFEIKAVSDQEREHILRVKCPGILFPYAREAIEGVIMRGRMPALILDPIDFEAS